MLSFPPDSLRTWAANSTQLTYYVDTATASRVPTAECFTVADGRIVASVWVFDRLAFSPPQA